jgi:hypothetical protein
LLSLQMELNTTTINTLNNSKKSLRKHKNIFLVRLRVVIRLKDKDEKLQDFTKR